MGDTYINIIIYHDTKVGNTASMKSRNPLMNNIINEMTSLTYSKLELSICLHSPIAATGINKELGRVTLMWLGTLSSGLAVP